MRLLITAVSDGKPVDIAVDTEDDAKVSDLAAALGKALPATVPAPEPHVAAQPALRVVGDTAPSMVAERPVPALYFEDQALDPGQALIDSPVRHGSILGIGAAVGRGLVEPDGLVEIRVTSGAGAGTVVRLAAGEYSIGTEEGCDLRLHEADLPGVCARVLVRVDGSVVLVPEPGLMGQSRPAPVRQRMLDGPIVLATKKRAMPKKPKPGTALPEGTITADPADPVPMIHMDRKEVTGEMEWPAGQGLAIGNILLGLERVKAADASMSFNPAGATMDYNRPPRLLPPDRRTKFGLPNEPQRPEKQAFPLLMMVTPLALGAGMYFFTGSAYSLLFMLMSPIMAIGNYSTGRRQNKRRFTNQFEEFAKRSEKVQHDALDALVDERNARRHDFADPAEVLLTAVGPRTRLWERRQTDPDFLWARLGTADQLSDVSVSNPQRESHEGDQKWTAPDVPVTVRLADVGVTGIAGPVEDRMALARWIICQTAVLQSPADVDMVLLSDTEDVHDWNWVRWLPHLRSDMGDSELAQVGSDQETTKRRISELLSIMEARVAAAKGGPGQDKGPAVSMDPMLIILDGARALRLLGGVPQLLQMGPQVRMYFLCLDADERLLPEECRAIVYAVADDFSVRVSGEATVEGVRADLVSSEWAEIVARRLAPVRDVSDVAAGGSIPGSSRLLNVIHLDPVTTDAVLDRWRSIGRTTEAIIGETADGPFAIDMVRDGPHGLVAGTTGAGKSELLQTIIASLAVNNRPDEMTYVLVDYKGGAAFKDCNNLPHTVGMVTDLDGHLTTRALDSLGAELRRREHQLAAADAKDIEDYLAAKEPDDEPMPRLLIVIDEFAALVAELPDFVTGLVDIARRGRSLGVHLILATQRPAGVVSAEIKSNTNLRIALRVTDAGDSGDVIEAPDAAQIAKSTPGRAYARLGHSSLILFQSSRVGGRPRGEGATAEISLREVSFATLGAAEEKAAVSDEEDINILTDLAAFVQAAREASEQSGIKPPPSPWLPAMDDDLTLEQVVEEFPAAVPSSEHLVVPFGMVDVPREQRRDVATFDLTTGGHLAIVGAPRSGRSTMLRAIAGAVGRWLSPEDVWLYGVDCGNNALLPLVGLPHVGAVVSRDQTDRMDRLVSRLQGVIAERQQSLALGGFADVTEQRANVPQGEKLPYIVILFDRWEGFFQAYDGLDGGRLVAAWQQILQEGAGVGIKIVMTGDRTLTVGRMSTLIDDKLMLRMVDMSDFAAIGMALKQVPSSMVEGRAFRAEGLRETQIGLLAEDPAGTAQVKALQDIGREATERYSDLERARRPFRLDVLPVRITLEEAKALQEEPLAQSTLVLAVGGDTLELRTLDAFEHGPGILVTGPRRTGRSTTLRTMATFALDNDWKVVVVTPRISPLRELCTHENVHGPFDESSEESELTQVLEDLRGEDTPHLVLVDDIELVGADGWLPTLLGEHLEAIRDTGSVLAGAGSPNEMGGLYRGPVSMLKLSGSGMMLSPQSSTDSDMFGARLARSVMGAKLPPGAGYLVQMGAAERVQVIWPE